MTKVDAEFYRKVGVNLKYLREERGLTLIELGKMAMCSGTTINKVELNLGSVNLWEHIDHLAEALNVPVDVLTEDNMQINADMQELHEAIERMEIKDPIIAKADALVLATSERGPRERVKALLIRAEMDMHRGRYESALNFANFAHGIVEKTSDKLLTNQVRYRIASIHLMLGNHQHVKNIIERDIRQLSDTEDSTRKAKSLYVLAQSCAQTGLWLDAEVHMKKGIELLESSNPDFSALGRYYHSLANVYQHKGLHRDANALFERAAIVSKRNADAIGEMYAHMAFVDNLYEMGMKSHALERLEYAKSMLDSVAVEHDYNGRLIGCYHALCIGDHESLIKRADSLFASNYPRNKKKLWYTRIAQVSHDNGDYDTSRKYFEKALDS